MKEKFLFLAVLFLVTACKGEFTLTETAEDNATSVTATHNGWSTIQAIGPVAPAAQAGDIASALASVTITWPAMTVSSGTISSYNVYRAATSGGQNYSSPLATGISASTRSFTDTSVTGGTAYYYVVAPVVNGAAITPASVPDSELKVIVPRDNMVLLHRWAANKEICEAMGKTPDRANDYRCAVATGANAPPGTGGSGYVDLGASLFVDRYEQGCNYTYDSLANQCGSANGCIGVLSDPNGSVTGNAGDIYYSRRSGACFLNTSAGSGTTWTAANSASAAQRQSMGSSAPGLPPFVVVSQGSGQDVCSGKTVTGFAGVKRLLKRREQLLTAAWDSSLSDSAVKTREDGVNLDSTHHCNSNYASPQENNTTDISATHPSMAFDNSALPAAKDTLPGCRSGNCSNTAAAIRSVRTGSSATSACVSRYGAQDMIGNVWEWVSDQISCNGAVCVGVAGSSNTVDTSNDDFTGLSFDGTQGPTASGALSGAAKFQFPVGIPIVSAGFTGDGAVSLTSDQLHDDYIYLNTSAATRGGVTGGSWGNLYLSGRYTLYLLAAPTDTSNLLGFRCAIPAE